MQRRNVIILMISLSLVLLLGSSYALLRSTKVGNNPYVVNVGNLQVTFEAGKTEKLSLENMYPMSDKEGISQSDELGFTVKNTGTVASYYDVYLEETSTTPEFKSVIRFISNKDSKGYNEPKTLSQDKYIDVGGYLESNKSSSYKVKIWLDYNADNTYMSKEFKAKVVVNSFQESNYAKDVIKSKLVKYSESSKEDFGGGLIAVNTDGDLYNETIASETIREYRYSGPSVNNYVTFNDEIWRIIGVFSDEVGNEHIKIVRDNVLTEIPATYKKNGTEYSLVGGRTAAWNRIGDSFKNNDWVTAGLQYYLNTVEDDTEVKANKGYLSTLKGDSLSMIADIKYYLGTIIYKYTDSSNFGIIDTPKEAYVNERAVSGCKGEVGPEENNNQSVVEKNSSCRVWANNQATWEGKIALLYPSDYGFSASSDYWETKLAVGLFNKGPSETSWLQKSANHNSYEWLLSPSSNASYGTSFWATLGEVNSGSVHSNFGVRPSLYIKSNVKITSGVGTQDSPYNLTLPTDSFEQTQ